MNGLIHESRQRRTPGDRDGAICQGHSDIFCATANPTEVVLAETEQGCGILGVVDGLFPKGDEDEGEIKWRKDFLRKIGYKL